MLVQRMTHVALTIGILVPLGAAIPLTGRSLKAPARVSAGVSEPVFWRAEDVMAEEVPEAVFKRDEDKIADVDPEVPFKRNEDVPDEDVPEVAF